MVQHGRFPTPDWLQPIPPPSARQQVTQENMTRFVAAGGMLDLARRLQSFVQDTIFPEHPFMLGVDHAMTGGVVAALAERYGRNELSIVIIDQHFDGLPLSLRVDTAMLPNGPALPGTGSDDLDDAYCCGNFVRHLIDTGTILPENLLFIGVADYPGEQVTPGNERFKENYLAMEKRGCRFFPAARFKGRYHQDLEQFIARHITTPNVYVSLDMDVGAHRCVHAARYMDTTGISREALRHIARAIAAGCGRGRYRLAGLDAVEFNMHFLGLEYEPGHRDATLSVALEFITEMIGAPDGP